MLQISSLAFEEGQEIPIKYTGEGDNISPPLRWLGVPTQARELALICDDPDAPGPDTSGNGSWVHWVIYGISPATMGLPSGLPPKKRLDSPLQGLQGRNSADRVGYTGPMPPEGHGWHRYYFKLYALNTHLNLPPGASKEELLEAMEGHIVAEAQFHGRYRREAKRKVS